MQASGKTLQQSTGSIKNKIQQKAMQWHYNFIKSYSNSMTFLIIGNSKNTPP